MIDEDAFLAHYGIKGMKWGVRKKNETPRSRTTYKGKATSLSDADLKARVYRLNMEKQYSKLVKQAEEANTPEASAIARGSKYVGGMLLKAGQTKAQNIVNDKVSDVADMAINRLGEQQRLAKGIYVPIAKTAINKRRGR